MSPEALLLLKSAHIISAAIIFGVGMGSAFYFFNATRQASRTVISFAARMVVLVDWLFILPLVIFQPASGFLLAYFYGYDPFAPWLVASYLLYVLIGLCWIPVVFMQIEMRAIAKKVMLGDGKFPRRFWVLRRRWFWLGWPAFGSMIVIFILMVLRPG